MKNSKKGFGNAYFDKKINKLIDDEEFILQTKKAIKYAKEGNFIESEKIYKALISQGKFDHLTLHRLAGILSRLGKDSESITYLNKTIKLKKDYSEAYGDIGNYYFKEGKIMIALEFFQNAIRYNPNLFGAYINIGNIFAKLGRHQEALYNYKKALLIKSDFPLTLYHIGDILLKEKEFDKAEVYFLRSLKYDKDFSPSKIELIRLYQETFNYKFLRNFRGFINSFGLLNGSYISKLLIFFYLDSSPDKQYKRAINYHKNLYSKNKTKNKIEFKSTNKIRVGYVSANFNDHPVLKVMESIFKEHDKTQFEIFAYYLNEIEDENTLKIKKYFKSFRNIGSLSINESIEEIRSDELDIAVDLMGYTNKNRMEIFNKRIAPIQINYLGFPGTTGAPNMDYLIADKFVIPPDYKKYYSENIIYMPNSFINSIQFKNNEIISDENRLNFKSELFLLAAFHNSSKISEENVNTWIKILLRTENTNLWIKNPNKIFKKNLIIYFKENGIDPKRIIFANQVKNYYKHISRYSLANLFLDTTNYNGHSTLLECIWAGLPFVTIVGDSFASRVGGSILNALNLNELITKSSEEYIEKVVFFTQNKDKLEIIRNKIIEQKRIGNFFDQKMFVKNLENSFISLIKKHKN